MGYATALFLLLAAPSQVGADESRLVTDDRARAILSGQGLDEQPHESAELRALREWELETFRPLGAMQGAASMPDLATPARSDPVQRQEDLPDALTSRVSPAASEQLASGSSDTGWLQGLSLPDLPFRWDQNVIYYLNFWRSDPRGHAIMSAWLRRVGRYGSMIRRVLASEGLPEDLQYVAMIESAYDPTARSAVGAVGLWQLMPRGGEIYGLRQDHWSDERRDPERSTRAAAAFLKDLFRRFGDWDLVLAAYHMGYAALLKSIRKYNTNDYWLLARLEAGLPFETTYYVPKILAAALVARNRERFGFGQVSLEPEQTADTVEVPGSIDFSTLARAAGCNRADIAERNPQLLRGRTPPVQGLFTVRIPAGKRNAFEAALPRLRGEARRYARYMPRLGDTLELIAHRHRITRRALAELNGMTEESPIRFGTPLVVPAVARLETDPTPPEPPVATVPAQRFTYPGRRRVFYTVVPGDTISAIAGFFGTNIEELRQWNSIEPTARLQSGMVLQLFVPTRFDLSRAVVLTEREVRILVQGSDEFFDHHERLRGRRRIQYTVRAGDSLQSIAVRFGLSVGSMARINQVNRDVALEPGRTLIVYAPEALAQAEPQRSAAAAEAALPSDTPEATPTVPEAPQPEEQALTAPVLEAGETPAQETSDAERGASPSADPGQGPPPIP